jgi:hypothetical protein
MSPRSSIVSQRSSIIGLRRPGRAGWLSLMGNGFDSHPDHLLRYSLEAFV